MNNNTMTDRTTAQQLANILEQGDEATGNDALVELVADFSEEAVVAFVEIHGAHYYKLTEADEWADTFRDCYIGEMTTEDYAEQLLDDGVFGNVDDTLRRYINIEHLAHDLRHDIHELGGFLFRAE